MQPTICRFDPAAEYFTPEQCFINELANMEADAAISIARARVQVGVQTRWHLLRDITERYVIGAGRGCVEVGDLPAQEVGPGDVVVIPPGVRQRIASVGDVDLVFLAVCTPRFVQTAYVDVDVDSGAAVDSAAARP